MDQLFLIDEKKGLDELPTAKQRKNDKVGRGAWTNFYAAYSQLFSDSAFEALGVREGELVFDPFLGSGTTAISCQKYGANFIGWDLDPFACLLSRAKIAVAANPEKVRGYLKPGKFKSSMHFDEQSYEIFGGDCLSYAAAVFSRVKRTVRGGKALFLNNVCSDVEGKYDSEVVAVVSLCIAASRAAKLIRGSNPTWYRKGEDAEFDFIGELKNEVVAVSEKLLLDLAAGANSPREFTKSEIVNCDASGKGQSLPDGVVDCVVTSPPYLTRIDYVVNHLPNLMLLSGLMAIDIPGLRSGMIGTSKIINKVEVNACWGGACVDLLRRIYDHESYASKRYYYWTYVQYFDAMYRAVINIYSKLKSGGRGVMVVQSSFYKDIHVPLSDILVDMIVGLGMQARVLKREPVKINMRSLQRSRVQSDKGYELTEDVIYFVKTDTGQ
ncbi:TPA: hypothetical protein SMQ04_001431 [Pseudomonas putida]|nr:hypothetical protein [Pseudomonas putida]